MARLAANTILNKTAGLAVGLAAMALAPSAANAALSATADTINGGFLYEGLGENPAIGPNIGTGRVTIGDCVFDGVNTVCTTTGTYTEDPTSSNDPGATGSFVFTQTFAGMGPSPALGRSIDPFGDFFQFFDVGDAIFEILVTPSTGGSFGGIFPDDPFEDSIGFFLEVAPGMQMCTGLDAMVTCGLGQAGLVDGATFAGPIGSFVFTIPDNLLPDDMTPIPLPAAAPLMLAGLAGLGAMRRRKKSAA